MFPQPCQVFPKPCCMLTAGWHVQVGEMCKTVCDSRDAQPSRSSPKPCRTFPKHGEGPLSHSECSQLVDTFRSASCAKMFAKAVMLNQVDCSLNPCRVFPKACRLSPKPYEMFTGWHFQVGELCKLVCESRYAYGDEGSPPDIPPKYSSL